MAHPDDAEILCGGTLVRLAVLGWQIHIATAANGDCGSVELGRDEIAKVRHLEAMEAAAKVGGIYHCLGLSDVQVAYSPENICKTIDLFRQVNPTLVITHPRYDYMLDHEQTHLLARAASFAFAIPNASLLPLAQSATVPYLYYADPLEGHDPYTGQMVEPTTLIDISDVMPAKTEMLACHASQREWLRKHHGMDEYILAMQRHCAMRGQVCNSDFAEAFVQHHGHAYPQDDLLGRLLGTSNLTTRETVND
ncbi:MAG: PIG-L domain-containing protein [Phycisphaeraceae bacterium]|nr:PIG-L domain-containing protein [Phycisphaeraceae bacterium]